MSSRNGTGQVETVSGRVEATNPKGIRVQGRWWNWSQYGPMLPRPTRGQAVRFEAKGPFPRALEIADGGHGEFESSGPTKAVLIVRQTCLKAAAEFCASRAE